MKPVLDYCPGCQRDLPLEKFALRTGQPPTEGQPHYEGETVNDLMAGPVVCQECRDAKRGPLDPALAKIPVRYRKILKDIASGRFTYEEVGRRHGLTGQTVVGLIRGNKNRPNQLEVQSAFQRLLESEGIDHYSIVRMMRACLYATRPYWNKAEERWDHFPDFGVRHNAIKHLTKLHRLEPPNEAGPLNVNLTRIEVHTNLDGSEHAARGEGPYIIEGERLLDAGDVGPEPPW